VMFEREFVRLLDQGLVVFGPVGTDFAQEIAKTCDRQNIGRDVLAQSRHVRLYDVLRARPPRLPFSIWPTICYS